MQLRPAYETPAWRFFGRLKLSACSWLTVNQAHNLKFIGSNRCNVDLPYQIVTASGAPKHLHAVGHRIEHPAERPVIIGVVQDVTERR